MKCFRYKLRTNPDGTKSGPDAVLPKGSVTGQLRVDGDGAWYYGAANIDSVAQYSEYLMEEISREVFDAKTLPAVITGTVVVSNTNKFQLVGSKVTTQNGSEVTLTDLNVSQYVGQTITVVEAVKRVSLRTLVPKRFVLKSTILKRLEDKDLDDAAYAILDLEANKKSKRRFDSAVIIDSEDDEVRAMLSAIPGCNPDEILAADPDITILNLNV